MKLMRNACRKKEWFTAAMVKRRIRSFFRDLSTRSRFDHFGIKGIDELKWAYFFILGTMSKHQTTLLDGRDDRDDLHNLLDGLDNEDQDEMRAALDNPIASSMKISAANLATYPQLKLMRHGVDGKVKMASTFS